MTRKFHHNFGGYCVAADMFVVLLRAKLNHLVIIIRKKNAVATAARTSTYFSSVREANTVDQTQCKDTHKTKIAMRSKVSQREIHLVT